MGNKKNKLFQTLKHLKPGNRINDCWTEERPRPRDSEELYRIRWQHDKIVRSTHGVMQLENLCKRRNHNTGRARHRIYEAPLEVIQSLLGHEKSEITRVYAQLSGNLRQQFYSQYF